MSEKIFTDANFDAEVLKANLPVVVDFWAEWCGPCRMIGPVIEKVAAANSGKVIVGKMNIDQNPETPQRLGVRGIPTILFFKGGSQVNSLVGYQSAENIQRAIDEMAG